MGICIICSIETRGSSLMVQASTEPEAVVHFSSGDSVLLDWRTALRAELDRAVVRGNGRWSRALIAVAGIHLLVFVACQMLHDPLVERDVRHLTLWIVELAAVIVTMRRVAGLGWFWSSPAINVIARLWVTFLILSFNVATLNALTGWESLWFKASWGTLSTFLFATLAWLFTPKFLIPAVQMYFTALLMARFPDWNNLVYGVSWWLALVGTAVVVRKRERVGATAEGLQQVERRSPQLVGAAAE
jgi:hypothetical protein